MTAILMATPQVLTAAADHLGRVGWFQGGFADELTGACCAVGSINYVLNGTPGCSGARQQAAIDALAALAAAIGQPWEEPDALGDDEELAIVLGDLVEEGLTDLIGLWNDAKDRTVDDVIAALRLAADRSGCAA